MCKCSRQGGLYRVNPRHGTPSNVWLGAGTSDWGTAAAVGVLSGVRAGHDVGRHNVLRDMGKDSLSNININEMRLDALGRSRTLGE